MTGTTVRSSRPRVGCSVRQLSVFLGLLTIIATLAVPVPVHADEHEAVIISPEADQTVSNTLELEAHATPGVAVNYAVRATAPGDGNCAVSYDVNGIARDVDGTTTTDADGIWTMTIDVSDTQPGLYCFAFDPADAPRITVRFTIGGSVTGTQIVSPEADQTVSNTLELEAHATPGVAVNYAVRATAPGDTNCAVSYDVNGIARDVDGTTTTDADGIWTMTIDVSDTQPGLYCFAFDPADAPRITVRFTIGDVEVEGEIIFSDEQKVACYTDQAPDTCSIETTSQDGQSFNITTTVEAKPDEQAWLRLRLPRIEDGVANSVSTTCERMLADHERLGGSVAHLAPSGFTDGNLTVTTRIPRSIINQDVSRGNPHFQVCVAPTAGPEAEAYPERYQGDLVPLGTTGLAGPILLDDCSSPTETACVESRERTRGADLIITFRLPTADPYFR